MRLIFDLECNGFQDTVTDIWCICTHNLDTGENRSFRYDEIIEGIHYLYSAQELIGHNIASFDLPILERVCPSEGSYGGLVTDTLCISRLIYTDLLSRDVQWVRREKVKNKNFDFVTVNSQGRRRTLIGSHSLEAWGRRLGELKGDYGKTHSFDIWTQELQDYCEQDIQVTRKLWELLESKNYSQTAIRLECDFQKCISLQEQHGWNFDEARAAELYASLLQDKASILADIHEMVPPHRVEFIPKVNNNSRGYVKGVPIIRETPFNPDSPSQVAALLITKYSWQPTKFTEAGQPNTGEETLNTLDYPEAKLLIRYCKVTKALERITGWLKIVKNGKVHGAVITNGTPTGRCTHAKVVNVPRVISSDTVTGKMVFGEAGKWGADQRSLFYTPHDASDPWILLGADAAGLELRCLAHYLAKYDGGEYGQIICSGDVHTANQEAAGLPTRNDAKTFIYGFIYGAGDGKLGSIVKGTAADGARLRASFLKKIPALKKLKEDLQKVTCESYTDQYGKQRWKLKPGASIGAIDGRRVILSSPHADLNYLLQSAGSIVVKKATVLFHEAMFKQFKYGSEWAMVGHFHDEMQILIRERITDDVKKIALQSFKDAGEFFKFRIPITGDVKTGRNWAETH